MNASPSKQTLVTVETVGFRQIPWKDILLTLTAATCAGFSGALVLGLVVFLLSAGATKLAGG